MYCNSSSSCLSEIQTLAHHPLLQFHVSAWTWIYRWYLNCRRYFTLPRQWSLTTLASTKRTTHFILCPRLTTAASSLYSIGTWDGAPSTYDGHLSFDVWFICSTLTRLGVSDLSVWRLNVFHPIWSTFTNATVRSALRVSERLTMEMIFLPIKLRVTAASACSNVKYCFPTRNRFTAAVGLRNVAWCKFPPLRRSVTLFEFN